MDQKVGPQQTLTLLVSESVVLCSGLQNREK